MHTRSKARAVAALAAVALAATLLAAPGAGAATKRVVKGTVICAHGNKAMGVWVESSAGGSRWAKFHRSATHPNAGFYTAEVTTAAASTKVRLHVGCGAKDTAGNWRSNLRTKAATVAGSRTLNTKCDDTKAGTQDNKCAWPPQGNLAPYNLARADPTQCTYGALEWWKQRTGTYPKWSGDAKDWAVTAAQNKWQTSAVPHVRAIVVQPATKDNPWGHVAYVRDVYPVAGGQFDIRIQEKNWDWKGGVRERTVRHQTGWRYIVSTL